MIDSIQTPPLPDADALVASILDSDFTSMTGRVRSASGSSIRLEGLSAAVGSVCEIRTAAGSTIRGQVIGFDGSSPVLSTIESSASTAAGDTVRVVDRRWRLRSGDALLGRVINASGQPIDGKPLPPDLSPIETDRRPPSALARPPVDEIFATGVRAIDTMLTCGRGQRLGIFAGSGVGKSTLMGMLARGCRADRIVIAMIGERGREVNEFIERSLGAEGLARSVVVVATGDETAVARVTAADTATSIAESFRDQGHNVLLLFDSVTRLAMAQREIGLAAGEPPTTRGYPPSVFSILPRMVERAGRTTTGSITAFYTVLVEGDDNNEPIADTLRGLLDGHIVLDRRLASAGHYPPIDVLESLSRLAAQIAPPEWTTSAMVARRRLAAHRRSEDLISIGAYRAGADPEVDAAIAVKPAIDSVLRQSAEQIVPLDAAAAAIAAAVGETPVVDTSAGQVEAVKSPNDRPITHPPNEPPT